jgi:hypothetical protein
VSPARQSRPSARFADVSYPFQAMSIIMTHVLNEVFAADPSLLVATNNTLSTPTGLSNNQFPYAEAILAGIHRADLLDNLAPESPSDAQLGQFTRWLHRRGVLASNS